MLTSDADTADFTKKANIQGFTPTKERGVKDAFDRMREAFSSKRLEDLSVSRSNALRDQYSGYIEQIKSATGEQLANPEGIGRDSFVPNPIDLMGNAFSNILFNKDWVLSQRSKYDARIAAFEEQVTGLKEKFPDLEVRSRDDFMKSISGEGAERRNRLGQGVDVGQAGLGGFIGEVGALATDPVNVASMMFGGAGAARSGATSLVSKLAQIGRTARTEAFIGIASEAAIQPQVFNFKKEIGSPYSVGDAAENILMAGVGGAALGGTAEVAGFGFRSLLGRWRKAKKSGQVTDTPESKAAEDALQDAVDQAEQSPFPDGVEFEVAHARAMDEATATAVYGTVNEGRVIDALKTSQRGKIKALVDETLANPAARSTRRFPDGVTYARIMSARGEDLAGVVKQDIGETIDFSNSIHHLNEEGVRHATNNHAGDKIPLRPEDLDMVPEVTQTGEIVSARKTDRKLPGIQYRKQINGNWLHVVEEVRRGKGGQTLVMKTAYWKEGKTKPGPKGPGSSAPVRSTTPRGASRSNPVFGTDIPADPSPPVGGIKRRDLGRGNTTGDSIAPAKGSVKAAEGVAGTATEQAFTPDRVDTPNPRAARLNTDAIKRAAESGTENRQSREAIIDRDARRLLDEDDIAVPVPGQFDEETGQAVVRSARELLEQVDDDVELADLIRVCGTGSA